MKKSSVDVASILEKIPDGRDPSLHPVASVSAKLEKKKKWAQPTGEAEKKLPEPRKYVRTLLADGRANAVGRRKRSIAEVWLTPNGQGRIVVNGKEFVDYFTRLDHRMQVIRPFERVGSPSPLIEEGVERPPVDKWDVEAKCHGGGITGQAEALRLGIARCLQKVEPLYRPVLKKDGLLTRDPRRVEPKKFGRKKARKAFQWVKR